MKPPNTSHGPEPATLPPAIVEALADALATALLRDLQQEEGEVDVPSPTESSRDGELTCC